MAVAQFLVDSHRAHVVLLASLDQHGVVALGVLEHIACQGLVLVLGACIQVLVECAVLAGHHAGGNLDHESRYLHPAQRMLETARNWSATLDLGQGGSEGLCRHGRSRLAHVRVRAVRPDLAGRL
jgi:hypothetical protein